MSKALVVIDMQNDFITGSLGTPEAEAIVQRVAEKIIGFDGPVVATKDTHDTGYEATQEGKLLPVRHCAVGSNGWEAPPDISKALLQKDYMPFWKDRFASLALAKHLEAAGYDEIQHRGYLHGYLRHFQRAAH